LPSMIARPAYDYCACRQMVQGDVERRLPTTHL
jgi:hypothetical protein